MWKLPPHHVIVKASDIGCSVSKVGLCHWTVRDHCTTHGLKFLSRKYVFEAAAAPRCAVVQHSPMLNPTRVRSFLNADWTVRSPTLHLPLSNQNKLGKNVGTPFQEEPFAYLTTKQKQDGVVGNKTQSFCLFHCA